jgi:hypothetical protein
MAFARSPRSDSSHKTSFVKRKLNSQTMRILQALRRAGPNSRFYWSNTFYTSRAHTTTGAPRVYVHVACFDWPVAILYKSPAIFSTQAAQTSPHGSRLRVTSRICRGPHRTASPKFRARKEFGRWPARETINHNYIFDQPGRP